MACGCKRVGVGARVAVVCAECGVWVRESSLRRGVDYVWREETNRRSGRDRAARRSDPSGTPPYRRAGARGRGAGAMASRVASGGSMPAPRRDVRKRENKDILTHKNVTAVRIIFFGKHAATCLTAPSSNETERVFSSFSLMTLDALITFVSCHSGMLRASGLRIQVQLEARALYREFLRNSSRKCHDSAGNPSNGNDPPAVEKWKL
ncbi:Protein of unknown function [Gryllus bimaculatus]|nr:Protein of unknown function [Gryllus bimaculatus]